MIWHYVQFYVKYLSEAHENKGFIKERAKLHKMGNSVERLRAGELIVTTWKIYIERHVDCNYSLNSDIFDNKSRDFHLKVVQGSRWLWSISSVSKE